MLFTEKNQVKRVVIFVFIPPGTRSSLVLIFITFYMQFQHTLNN